MFGRQNHATNVNIAFIVLLLFVSLLLRPAVVVQSHRDQFVILDYIQWAPRLFHGRTIHEAHPTGFPSLVITVRSDRRRDRLFKLATAKAIVVFTTSAAGLPCRRLRFALPVSGQPGSGKPYPLGIAPIVARASDPDPSQLHGCPSQH